MEPEQKQLMEVITHFLSEFTYGFENLEFEGYNVGSGMILLNYVGSREKCNMGEISKFLNVIKSTATKKVSKLIDLGLLERVQDENDRRIVLVILSEEGRRLYSKFMEGRMKLLGKIIKSFSNEEKELLIKLFEKLITLYESNKKI